MNVYEIGSMAEKLANNTYPGRGIVLGVTPDGKKATTDAIERVLLLDGVAQYEEARFLSLPKTWVPDNAALVVINEPQFDFSDGEIARLETYITNKGNVMIFTNPTYNDEIIGLRAFLEARCGIKITKRIFKAK